MPRGIPNKKRRSRKSNGEAEATATEPEVDEEGNPIVAGESESPPTLGEAVEIVRDTLSHFEDSDRKRVLKAAATLLKG